MTATEHKLNPTVLSKEDLLVLASTLAGLLKEEINKPMSAKEAMAWTGFNKTKFFQLKKAGVIKGHLDAYGDPVYLRSELIEAIRNS